MQVNKRKVTEGEIVELHWDFPQAESCRLTIDNGHRSDSQLVDAVANKKFRLNRPGKTVFIITTTQQGKSKNHKVTVRVKKQKPIRAQVVDDQGRSVSRLKQWWQRWRDTVRYNLQCMPAPKRLALRLFIIVGAVTLLMGLFPKLFLFGQLLIMLYLAYLIVRK